MRGNVTVCHIKCCALNFVVQNNMQDTVVRSPPLSFTHFHTTSADIEANFGGAVTSRLTRHIGVGPYNHSGRYVPSWALALA
jgi:hypothetical protein